MLKLTSSRLQLLWVLLVEIIVLVSLIPHVDDRTNSCGLYFNRYWVHFLAYVAVSFLPPLAWRRRKGLIISMGMVLLAVGVEIVRVFAEKRPPDIQHTVINTLGIAAGILLGLNILTLRSRRNQADC